MTHQFIQPNTRTEWKQQLLDAAKAASAVILVEPDKQVVEFLKSEEITYVLVDPQHQGKNTHSSAIKMAENMWSAPDNSLFIGGFKTDLDMVGAMALLAYPAGPFQNDRISLIDSIDTGAFFGEWNPNQVDDNTLLLLSEEVSDTKILGAMCADVKKPLGEKVSLMADWLAGGIAPQQFKQQLLNERKLLLQAVTEVISGIKIVTCSSAGVSSLIYQNTSVAGEGRPFGVAFNPNFRGQGPKYSVLQHKNQYFKAEDLFNRLNEIEEAEGTWGGNLSLGIGGSPLGTSLTSAQVAEVMVECLTDKGREYLLS